MFKRIFSVTMMSSMVLMFLVASSIYLYVGIDMAVAGDTGGAIFWFVIWPAATASLVALAFRMQKRGLESLPFRGRVARWRRYNRCEHHARRRTKTRYRLAGEACSDGAGLRGVREGDGSGLRGVQEGDGACLLRGVQEGEGAGLYRCPRPPRAAGGDSMTYIRTRGRCGCGRGINKGAAMCKRCRRVPCKGCGKPTKGGRCHSCASYSNGISPKRLNIRALIGGNPCLTLQQVGDMVGVSQEYVRQIVVMDDLEREKQVRRSGIKAKRDKGMSWHQTMTPTEEARWLKAVQDGSLGECQDEWEASEQMALWRQAGNTLKEIGLVYC